MKRLLGQGNENKPDRVTAFLPKTARRTERHEMSLDPAPRQRNKVRKPHYNCHIYYTEALEKDAVTSPSDQTAQTLSSPQL